MNLITLTHLDDEARRLLPNDVAYIGARCPTARDSSSDFRSEPAPEDGDKNGKADGLHHSDDEPASEVHSFKVPREVLLQAKTHKAQRLD